MVETVQPQDDSSATCVIAQQYSSATLVSLRSHSRQETLGPFLKNFILMFYLFERKLHRSEFGSLEIVCVSECLKKNIILKYLTFINF
jgi:hypothetical protein